MASYEFPVKRRNAYAYRDVAYEYVHTHIVFIDICAHEEAGAVITPHICKYKKVGYTLHAITHKHADRDTQTTQTTQTTHVYHMYSIKIWISTPCSTIYLCSLFGCLPHIN